MLDNYEQNTDIDEQEDNDDMLGGWQEVNLDSSDTSPTKESEDFEIEKEDDSSEDEDDSGFDIQEKQESGNKSSTQKQETETDSTDPKNTDTEDEDTKRKSRSQQRILELLDESTKKDEILTKLTEERETLSKRTKELEEKLQNTTKSSFDSRKNLLKQQKDGLKAQLLKAKEEGDFVTELDVQQKFNDVNTQLMILAAQEAKNPTNNTDSTEQEKPQEQSQQQQQQPQQTFTNNNDDSVKMATSWIQKNIEQIKQEPRISLIASKLENEILTDGYDPKTEDFWDEMANRINELGFSVSRMSNNSTETNNTKATQTEEAKPKPSGPPTATQSQSTGSSAPSGKNNNKVKLTKKHLEIAKKYNLTPEQMAKALKKTEKKDSRGWSEVVL